MDREISGLTFDEPTHTYRWNGRIVPSTTQVCAMLAPRWECDPYYLRRGQLVHLITEWDDQGVLDEKSVDPELAGYLEAWRNLKKQTGFVRDHIEHRFYHQKYHYCGRVDGHGIMLNTPSVGDIKIGQPCEADSLQSSAYLFGLRSNNILTERAFDFYLKQDGKFKIKEVRNVTSTFFRFLEGIELWRKQNVAN